jgi:hypothetical protein
MVASARKGDDPFEVQGSLDATRHGSAGDGRLGWPRAASGARRHAERKQDSKKKTGHGPIPISGTFTVDPLQGPCQSRTHRSEATIQ